MESDKDIILSIKQGIDRLTREEAKEALDELHNTHSDFSAGAVFGMYIMASVMNAEILHYFGYSAEEVSNDLGIQQLADMLEKR